MAYKVQTDGLTGQYRIEQQEQSHGARGIDAQRYVELLLRYPAFQFKGGVHDHQYHKRHAGEVVVDKSQPADQTPGQVLGKVTDAEPERGPVLLPDHKVEHIEESGNADPPYQGIAESADTLAQRHVHGARIVENRLYHSGPLIPGGTVVVLRFQLGMVAEHVGLVIPHAREQSFSAAGLEGQVGEKVDDEGDHYKKQYAESDGGFRVRREAGHHVGVGNAVAGIVGRGLGVAVFPVTAVQSMEKEHRESRARVYAGPFAGDAKPHGNPAGTQRQKGFIQGRIVKAHTAVVVHEIVHEQDEKGHEYVNGGDPGLGEMHKIKSEKQAGKAAKHTASGQVPSDQVKDGQHQDAQKRAHDTPAEGRHAEKADPQGHDDLAQGGMGGFIGGQSVYKFISRSGVVDLVKVCAVTETEFGSEHIHFVKERCVIGSVDRHIDISVRVRQDQLHDGCHIAAAGQFQEPGTGRQFLVSPLEDIGHGEGFIAGSCGPFRIRRVLIFQGKFPVVIVAQVPVKADGQLALFHFQFDGIALMHQVFRLGRVTVPQIPQGEKAVPQSDDKDKDKIHQSKRHLFGRRRGLIGNAGRAGNSGIPVREGIKIKSGDGGRGGGSAQQTEEQSVKEHAHQQEGRGEEQDHKGFPAVILVVVKEQGISQIV